MVFGVFGSGARRGESRRAASCRGIGIVLRSVNHALSRLVPFLIGGKISWKKHENTRKYTKIREYFMIFR